MKRDYVIGEVLDKQTGERSKEWGYRVGRKCQINDENVQEGACLFVYYPERESFFRTSLIMSVEETDGGLWVETMNSQYRFDRVVESEYSKAPYHISINQKGYIKLTEEGVKHWNNVDKANTFLKEVEPNIISGPIWEIFKVFNNVLYVGSEPFGIGMIKLDKINTDIE